MKYHDFSSHTLQSGMPRISSDTISDFVPYPANSVSKICIRLHLCHLCPAHPVRICITTQFLKNLYQLAFV